MQGVGAVKDLESLLVVLAVLLRSAVVLPTRLFEWREL